MHVYREKDQLYTRIIRLKHLGKSRTFNRVIFDRIPSNQAHIGGRIAFGPDDMLYGTGDTNSPPSRKISTRWSAKSFGSPQKGTFRRTTPFRIPRFTRTAIGWYRGWPGTRQLGPCSIPSTGPPALRRKGRRSTGMKSTVSSQARTMDGRKWWARLTFPNTRIRSRCGKISPCRRLG